MKQSKAVILTRQSERTISSTVLGTDKLVYKNVTGNLLKMTTGRVRNRRTVVTSNNYYTFQRGLT